MSATGKTVDQALREFAEAIASREVYDEEFWDPNPFDLEFLSDAVNESLYGADYPGAIEALQVIDNFIDHVRAALVIACRSTGESWDNIGRSMGRERQWAWRTYHQRADYNDDRDESAVAEFANTIPDLQRWGINTESMEPQMREAVSRSSAKRCERSSVSSAP